MTDSSMTESCAATQQQHSVSQFLIHDQQTTEHFLRRLANEHHWSLPFARLAFDEYRRFLTLAALSEQRLVPSKVIDKVWHLHLTYTRSYWDDLCGQVLNKKFHHQPSLPSKKAAQQDEIDYKATLSIYRKIFQQQPVESIWPPTNSCRCSKKASVIQSLSSLTKSSSLSKQSDHIYQFDWGKAMGWKAIVLLVSSLFLVSACTETTSGTLETILKWVVGIVAVFLFLKFLKWLGGGSGKGGGSCSGSGCSSCGGCGGG